MGLSRFLCPILLALAAAIAAVATAHGEVPTRKPNILWIVAENIGPDFGCYGYPGVVTPNVDRLAREGMRYRLAFDTSPVCSVSRSAFMTGMYSTTIGTHNHRSHRFPGVDDHYHLPAGVRPLPQRLREAGYFTANITTMAGKPVGTGKTDLNFEVEGEVLRPQETLPSAGWGGSEIVRQNFANSVRLFEATEWTQLPKHHPFYAQINLPTVELGAGGWTGSAANPWNAQTHPTITDPSRVEVPPYYPDHPVVRRHWAGYLDSIHGLDTRVGEILSRLEADGLADDTVVIFFADNGRLELRGLDWCYDSGDRVPLIVRWPKNFPAPPQYRAGRTSEQLVSLLDLTATTLAIAGVPKPAGMQSQIFLGADADPARKIVFSTRDRMDEAVQRIRSVRSHRYRYIRNFMPERPFLAPHRYKEARFPAVPLLRAGQAAGSLTDAQLTLVADRLPDEELYDTETDPHEIHNLAASSDPEHQRILKELRGRLDAWIVESDDQGRFPEPPGVLEFWRTVYLKMFPVLLTDSNPAGALPP